MGYATALGYAELVENGMFDLPTVLAAHLGSNLLPPPPPEMLEVAVAAIEHYDEPDLVLDLPVSIVFRDGRNQVTVAQAIETLFLEAFLPQDAAEC